MSSTPKTVTDLKQVVGSWNGWGDDQVSVGEHGAGQWIAVFYSGHGGHQPVAAAGTAQAPTPWRAVQRAAWAVKAQ